MGIDYISLFLRAASDLLFQLRGEGERMTGPLENLPDIFVLNGHRIESDITRYDISKTDNGLWGKTWDPRFANKVRLLADGRERIEIPGLRFHGPISSVAMLEILRERAGLKAPVLDGRTLQTHLGLFHSDVRAYFEFGLVGIGVSRAKSSPLSVHTDYPIHQFPGGMRINQGQRRISPFTLVHRIDVPSVENVIKGSDDVLVDSYNKVVSNMKQATVAAVEKKGEEEILRQQGGSVLLRRLRAQGIIASLFISAGIAGGIALLKYASGHEKSENLIQDFANNTIEGILPFRSFLLLKGAESVFA